MIFLKQIHQNKIKNANLRLFKTNTDNNGKNNHPLG